MARLTIDLKQPTAPGWAEYVAERFDEFLIDHANCERKASALAMSFVVRYSDRIRIHPTLIDLAQEELLHFKQVYELMLDRGLLLVPDEKDPYVNNLIGLCRSGREERFLDRLLVASLVESRGAERFRLLHEVLADPALKAFYRDLWACEAKHGNQFTGMALEYFPAETVYDRLDTLAEGEAQILTGLPWRASLH